MSQASVDISTLGNIVSSFFDGKLTIPEAETKLGNLGQTISGQISSDVSQVETFLGPQALAEIKSGLSALAPIAAGALSVMDADLQPYGAGAALVVEGAVDTLMAAAGVGSLD